MIIPTYERRDFLEKALMSVLKQTFRDFELLVVDDGSDDGTVDLIRAQKDKRVKYFYQENEGPSSARNIGIKLSKGTYIAFLDSDDTWKKKKLEIQYSGMEEKEDFLLSHTDEVWYKDGKHINPKEKHLKRQGDVFDQAVKLCAISMSTVMVRRELFDKMGMFDENMMVCEDYDFWLRITARYPVLLIDEKLTVKQAGHSDQVSESIKYLDKYRIYALERLIKRGILDRKKEEIAINELIRKCKIYSKGCIKHGKIDEGKYYYSLITKYKAISNEEK